MFGVCTGLWHSVNYVPYLYCSSLHPLLHRPRLARKRSTPKTKKKKEEKKGQQLALVPIFISTSGLTTAVAYVRVLVRPIARIYHCLIPHSVWRSDYNTGT